MIDFIEVRSETGKSGWGAEGSAGEIEGPEHHQGGVGIDALGRENAVGLGAVESQVTRRFRDA